MNTIIYLIRHSVRFSMDDIDTYNTTQSYAIKIDNNINNIKNKNSKINS